MATKKKAKKKRYWVNVYGPKRFPSMGGCHESKKSAESMPDKIKTISFTI